MNIGIDIGGSHIGIALINKNVIKKKIELDINKKDNIKKYILDIVDYYINELLKIEKIEKIGIVGPGTPIKNEIGLKRIVNLGISEIKFDYISKKYNIPIQVGNDAKAAGLAEFKIGSLKKYNDSVFLCLGTGIGSAVFLNGELLVANKNMGFELGHMIINKNGLQCNCGKKGCFETYCSIKRFKENIKKILNIQEIESKDVLSIITSNMDNKKIVEVINEYIDNLIVGLSNIIDIFEPEAICIGGSFVHFKSIFYERLVDEINKRKYYFNKDSTTKIVLAELKNDAGMIRIINLNMVFVDVLEDLIIYFFSINFYKLLLLKNQIDN